MVSCNQIKYLIFAFVLNFLSPKSNAQAEKNPQPEVTIPQGTLRGTPMITRNGRNISAFLGIPYAQPPTGNLRFRNPIPAGGWNGTRNATVDANMCLQDSGDAIRGDEDCLYLNVYIPYVSQSSDASSFPVMVYIHGGAFQVGSSATTSCGPGYLLDEDVILVTMNYRVNVFGFLSTGDEAAYGNYGLKDIVLSLNWTQNNIEYFGGDRNRVTLFGESSGSSAVHLLSLSNSTTGLFQKYITQSGSAFGLLPYRPRAPYASRAFELGEYVGCPNDTTASLVNCLRKTSGNDILNVQSRFPLWRSYPAVIWGPTDEPDIEGALLTDSPTNLLTDGKIRDLPWISGINRDEGTYFIASEGIVEDLKKNFEVAIYNLLDFKYQSDEISTAWTNAIKSFYFNDDLTMNNTSLFKNLSKLVGDAYFVYPAYKSLQLHHTHAVNPQYFYLFSYKGTYSWIQGSYHKGIDYGVLHSDGLFYLFPVRDRHINQNKTMSAMDHKMVDVMVRLWTSFAVDGIPSISSLNRTTTWDSYSTADNYLLIGNGSETTVEMQYSLWKDRMEFWENMYNMVETPTAAPYDSGSMTLTPSFFFVFLTVSSVYLFATSTVDMIE